MLCQVARRLLSAKEKETAAATGTRLTVSFTRMPRPGLVMDPKNMALNAAISNFEALQHSHNSPAKRMRYFLQLADERLSAIPSGNASSKVREFSNKL